MHRKGTSPQSTWSSTRSMMASTLEEILARLLVPDNSVIRQATKELQAVYKDPAIIPPLCEILVASPNPQLRQYAAILLRKRIVKIWKRLSLGVQQRTKVTLLQCLAQENMHLVVRSIAYLASVIAKHELSQGQEWNELNEFIMQHSNSPEPHQREIGMLVLSSLVDTATLQLQPKFEVLLQLFSDALKDGANKMVPFYALKSLTSMVEYVTSNELPHFQAMIPQIMVVIKALITQDEDKACDAMELFDELVECDVGIVVPHLTSLIQFCLEVASNVSLSNNLRVKAISFVSWLTTLKKKTLLKHGLLPNILQTMLLIMSTPTSDGADEEEDDLQDESNTESHSPIALAAQVLDVLSLNLPPDKIFTPVMQLIHPWFQSPNHFQRSSSLVAIAVITEGCSEHIKKNHLTTLLQIVYKGVTDEQRIVRNASLFAIGQFAEHLQPDISQFSSELMPVLFQFMDVAIAATQQQHKESTGLTKIFYALETFSEQLGADLLPYLPTYMEKLFYALSVTNNAHVQELVVSAFGAAANACEEKLVPYFPRIIQVLKELIELPHTQERSILKAQAVDTLGILARTIGEEHFRPLSQECVLLGMTLMQSPDPDLRRSVYGMFASVSYVLKEGMAANLEAIVNRMLESLLSEEGVTVHHASFETSFLDFEAENRNGVPGGEDDEAMGSIEDDGAIEGFSVENAYVEEKEDTCNALGEIAENLGVHFIPFIDECFKEVNALSEHSAEGIRKAAIWALSRFCKVWRQHVISSGGDRKDDLDYLINYTLGSMSATVRTDCDQSVVGATLEALEDLLKSLKTPPFPMQERVVSSLMVSVQDIVEYKAQCQGGEEMLPGEDMAEYDSMLVECAGSILGPLASVVGGEVFLKQFEALLPKLLAQLKRKTATVADKSFIIGTFAEIVDGVGNYACLLLDFYQLFMEYSGDQQDEEVCSNSVYGLGLLAANALPNILNNYPAILQHLFAVAQSRSTSHHHRVIDNVCGAVCRMIMASQEAVPLDQVIPLLVRSLPLKEDMEEYETVYNCIIHLFTNKNPVMMTHLQTMLQVFAQEFSLKSKLPKDLQLQLAQLLQMLNSQCPEQMQAASNGLSQEQLTLLTSALHEAAGTGTSRV